MAQAHKAAEEEQPDRDIVAAFGTLPVAGHGGRRATLTGWSTNSWTRRLYERHGFTVESEDPLDVFMLREPVSVPR